MTGMHDRRGVFPSWFLACVGLTALILAMPVRSAGAGEGTHRIVLGSDGSLPCQDEPTAWEPPRPEGPGRACPRTAKPADGAVRAKGGMARAPITPTSAPITVVVENVTRLQDEPPFAYGVSDAERALDRNEAAIRAELFTKSLADDDRDGVVVLVNPFGPGTRAATAAERELDRVESLRRLDQLGGVYRGVGRTIVISP